MGKIFEEAATALINSLKTTDSKYINAADACIDITAEAIREDRRVFVCGNGGSAATASHIANDMLCHMKNWNRKGYRVISLVDSTSVLTSLSNDYGAENVFAKQLEALGEKGDVLWAFSTSGNSANCVQAIQSASKLGIKSVAFTGRGGGKMKDLCDLWIPVDSDEVMRVEELHLVYAHIIGESVESIVSPCNA